MNILILLAAAFLPAIFLWFYIWKQDPQPEPTNWLAKAGFVWCVNLHPRFHFRNRNRKYFWIR